MKNKLFDKFRRVWHRFTLLRKIAYLPGEYSSPIVMPGEIKNREASIFKIVREKILGIELNEEKQFILLEILAKYYADLPFSPTKKEGTRYYYDNPFFSYNSSIELFGIIRHFKPQKIVEVGSGFSSALILDTNDLFMEGKVKCTFIDPFPARLLSLLNDQDKAQHTILAKKVQEVDVSYFDQLQEGDILFIDSSHVSKTGSDLNFLLFNVLPILKKGVIIHFHDIFYPFEYPREWVMNPNGFGWNECYILRAFLMFNSSYEILFFNTYMEHFYKDWFIQNMPACLMQQGGSLYIVKKD